ncbi:MAG: hypothetical protein A2X80_11035 [Geobacteraceae bacterium GWB2_52_12]|nr:MAG: hypothetical protein A2X80_11035 [Geobacteraceae bacterium GWB2_52_12]
MSNCLRRLSHVLFSVQLDNHQLKPGLYISKQIYIGKSKFIGPLISPLNVTITFQFVTASVPENNASFKKLACRRNGDLDHVKFDNLAEKST